MVRTRAEAEIIVNERFKEHKLAWNQIEFLICRYQEVSNGCKNCFTIGVVYSIIHNEIRSSDCICRVIERRKSKISKMYLESALPERYKDADIQKWQNPGVSKDEIELNQKSLVLIERYAADVRKHIASGTGLFICGPNGVGKTFLACAVSNVVIASNLSVKYFTLDKIIKTEIDGWRNEESKVLMDNISNADLLVVDDIDKVYRTKTGIENSLFDNLLRCRLQDNKPCIFTSNKTLDDILRTFGQSVYSMLVEQSCVIVLVGADYRKKISDNIRKALNDS